MITITKAFRLVCPTLLLRKARFSAKWITSLLPDARNTASIDASGDISSSSGLLGTCLVDGAAFAYVLHLGFRRCSAVTVPTLFSSFPTAPLQ